MSVKASAVAPANIAFIKYWGALDLDRAIPANASISMTLHRCLSFCTVEFLAGLPGGEDLVELVDELGRVTQAPAAFAHRILRHLDRLRSWAGVVGVFRVATRNSFPSASGLASSASGFAALTLATTSAMGSSIDALELSRLARESGSGSAARSALGGFVEWPVGEDEACRAAALADRAHWDLRDVIAVVDLAPKAVSSLDGHGRAATSPYYAARQALLPARLAAVRDAISRRSFDDLAPVVEEEAVDLHLIAMSSRPPIFYWRPGTVAVMQAVRELRQDGVPACFTIDAGANVHVLCLPEAEPTVAERIADLPGVAHVIRDGVGDGPRLTDEHLF